VERRPRSWPTKILRREPAGPNPLGISGMRFQREKSKDTGTGGVAVALPPATMVQTFGLEIKQHDGICNCRAGISASGGLTMPRLHICGQS
jgi:hypothetical protein